jgi:hypothetical protein
MSVIVNLRRHIRSPRVACLGGVLIFVCLLLAPRAAAQTERIRSFRSDIQVRDDGTMLVRETILVISTGDRIRHGIYRDFPTRYTDRLGNRYVVGFTLLEAIRDHAPEVSRIEKQANGVRVYLGRDTTLVPAGVHNYTISYTTNRQIGFFKDHDELFWNVTGNGWIFPIDNASAVVHLPQKIPTSEVRLDGFTGASGSLAKDFHTRTFPRAFYFFSAHPLGAHEGLTILLQWPKGYFQPPSTKQKIAYFAQDNPDVLVASIGWLLILLYYVIVWFLVGRDPAPGSIMPLYQPPTGFSPPAMRYLVRMGYDDKVFTSAVLDMAVKGFLKIDEGSGVYTLSRTQAGDQTLTQEERAAASKLFGGTGSINLKQQNHAAISAAMASLRAWLKTAEQKIYFVTNGPFLIPAVAFSVLVLLAVLSMEGQQAIAFGGFMSLWLSLWSIAVFEMMRNVGHLWKSAWAGGHLKAGLTASATFATLFSIFPLAGEIFGLGVMVWATSAFVTAVFLMTVFLHVLFHQLLKAPTSAGRGVLDKIEGFKMFLGAVEGDRMNRLMPPEQTPEVFEKFLPYALALDVEQAWAEKFSAILGGAGHSSGSNSNGYSPSWYSGDFSTMGTVGFASSLSGAFSSAISSSSSAPGSSGGGGGGSGGGGGGGGGGGW